MNIKKGISNDEDLVEVPKENVVEEPKIMSYSVIAEYDGLILDKNDMKSIYSELKKVKANVNRSNMEKTKYIYLIYIYIYIYIFYQSYYSKKWHNKLK